MMSLTKVLTVMSLFGGFVGVTALLKGYQVLDLALWMWPRGRNWTLQLLATHAFYLGFLVTLANLPGEDWAFGPLLRMTACVLGLLLCLLQQIRGIEALMEDVVEALREGIPGAIAGLPGVDHEPLKAILTSFRLGPAPGVGSFFQRVSHALDRVPDLLSLMELTKGAAVGDTRSKWHLWAILSYTHFDTCHNLYRAAFWRGAMEAAGLTDSRDLEAVRLEIQRTAVWSRDVQTTGRREGFQYLDELLNGPTNTTGRTA